MRVRRALPLFKRIFKARRYDPKPISRKIICTDRNHSANTLQSLFARAGFFAIIYLLQSFQNSNFQKSLQTGKRSIQTSNKLPQLSLEIRFRTQKREANERKKEERPKQSPFKIFPCVVRIFRINRSISQAGP